MKKLLIALCILSAAVVSAAEARIAVVNLDRVFKSYYKSRIAEDFLNQQAEAARAYMSQMNSQLEALRSEARRLGTNALNPALTDQARKKAADAADAAMAKVKSKETEISLYANERRREFMRLQQEKRSEIVKDIQKEVKRRAAAGNYAFVLDSSGNTTSGLPAVLIYPGRNDISDEVIRELNRAASKPKQEK